MALPFACSYPLSVITEMWIRPRLKAGVTVGGRGKAMPVHRPRLLEGVALLVHHHGDGPVLAVLDQVVVAGEFKHSIAVVVFLVPVQGDEGSHAADVAG